MNSEEHIIQAIIAYLSIHVSYFIEILDLPQANLTLPVPNERKVEKLVFIEILELPQPNLTFAHLIQIKKKFGDSKMI